MWPIGSSVDHQAEGLNFYGQATLLGIGRAPAARMPRACTGKAQSNAQSRNEAEGRQFRIVRSRSRALLALLCEAKLERSVRDARKSSCRVRSRPPSWLQQALQVRKLGSIWLPNPDVEDHSAFDRRARLCRVAKSISVFDQVTNNSSKPAHGNP